MKTAGLVLTVFFWGTAARIATASVILAPQGGVQFLSVTNATVTSGPKVTVTGAGGHMTAAGSVQFVSSTSLPDLDLTLGDAFALTNPANLFAQATIRLWLWSDQPGFVDQLGGTFLVSTNPQGSGPVAGFGGPGTGPAKVPAISSSLQPPPDALLMTWSGQGPLQITPELQPGTYNAALSFFSHFFGLNPGQRINVVVSEQATITEIPEPTSLALLLAGLVLLLIKSM